MTLGSRVGRRDGAVLVVVLICLAVAAVIIVLVVKQAGEERRTIRTSHQGVQALWLAEAGIERAAAQLVADSEYVGETWAIPAEQLAGEGGVVRIRVQAVAGQPEQRSVRVEADYPDAPTDRCRQVKQIVMDREAIRSD